MHLQRWLQYKRNIDKKDIKLISIDSSEIGLDKQIKIKKHKARGTFELPAAVISMRGGKHREQMDQQFSMRRRCNVGHVTSSRTSPF